MSWSWTLQIMLIHIMEFHSHSLAAYIYCHMVEDAFVKAQATLNNSFSHFSHLHQVTSSASVQSIVQSTSSPESNDPKGWAAASSKLVSKSLFSLSNFQYNSSSLHSSTRQNLQSHCFNSLVARQGTKLITRRGS